MGYSFHDPLQQVLSDLDKCPKPIKIASSRVRVWGKRFVRILQKRYRLLARAGVGFVRILTKSTLSVPPRACGCGGQPQIFEGTRRLPGEVIPGSRSGVGLVPVAVNDYSAQKGGAEVVPAWCRPVSRLHCPPSPWAMAGRCAGG